MLVDSPHSNEFQSKENKEQAKVLCFLVVPFTLIWHFELFSDGVYATMMFNAVSAMVVLYLEANKPSLGQNLKAVHMGFLPVIVFALCPKYALFVICLNFFGLANFFSEVSLSKVPIILSINTASWLVYYQFMKFDDYEGAELVRFLFQDSNNLTQIAVCYFVCYFCLVALARKKYMEGKVHKKYHETLVSLNKELEIANEKLKNTNKDLQDALQEKENFILRFSHEIRNPLNSLLGNIDLCHHLAEEAGLRSMLTDAKVSGEILLQLLNNVLDTAKVSAGRLEISANPHSVREFVQRAWVICSEIIHKKGLYGSFAVNLDVPEVLEFDHHRMMQILINMVSNATKFTDRGHVKIFLDFIEGTEIKPEHMKPVHGKLLIDSQEEGNISIKEPIPEEDFTENLKFIYEYLTSKKKQFVLDRANLKLKPNANIEIPVLSINALGKSPKRPITTRIKRPIYHNNISPARVDAPEGYIRLEIVDSGRGIKKEDLKTLFEKFKQVDEDSSKRQIGTGLGLWITKEIIGLMEGDIEIYSVLNQGTVLVLMLKSKSSLNPAIAISPDKRPKLSVDTQPKFSAYQQEICKRALIVEDIPYNQEVNKKMLQKCNVENITIANNGLEALELFKTMGPSHFDLILMDIDMPVMDGKEATKKIRQFEEERGWPPINLVFLTGFAEAKTQKELLDKNGEYRANNFISKPASLDMIMSIVGGASPLLVDKGQRKIRLSGSMVLDQPLSSKKYLDVNRLLFSEKKAVLLVDDDSFNLAMLSKMLEIRGFETLQARNGEMAIELYEKNWNKIDIILMDCEMPVMDGLEATEIIFEKRKQKAHLLSKHLKIYGVTGHIGAEYKKRCLTVGMRDVFEKPIDTENLISLLQNPYNK